jgi:transcriptional regulator with GAF, ATPase, and Fis domain
MSEQVAILQSLQPVLSTLVEAGLASCDGVLAQAWLVGPGDRCDSCPMRPECPSRSSCLHLVASAGVEDEAADRSRRVPIGIGSLGRIPVSHEPLVARSGLDALGLAGSAWLTRNKVHALAALPLEHGERSIGVLAVFSRGRLPEEQMRVLVASTRLGAEALGNVAAFRTLAADRNRLAAKNARLRSGLGLLPEPEAAAAAAPVPALPPPAPVADPPAPAPPRVPPSGASAVLGVDAAISMPLHSFAEVQREGILRTLERTGWRVSGPKGAAAVLRLKPTTLESKMKKLGIHRPPR